MIIRVLVPALTGTIRPGWPHPDGALGPLAARTADG